MNMTALSLFTSSLSTRESLASSFRPPDYNQERKNKPTLHCSLSLSSLDNKNQDKKNDSSHGDKGEDGTKEKARKVVRMSIFLLLW